MPNFFLPAMLRTSSAILLLAALSGCATVTEPATQTILVQAVEGNRPLANVGCLLANDAGRWYVNAPGRVKVTKRARSLSVDCRKEGGSAGYEVIASRANATALWGNAVVTAGVGYLVDRNTGAGHDYPDTITIVMKAKPQGGEADADPTLASASPIY
jgi:hypothetical protein